MLRTPLCDLLGIRYPIVQAPMAGGWTTPELVAAVSNAGGLGMLAATRVSPERLRADIRATRALTDKPFGANVQLAPPEPERGDASLVQHFLDRFRPTLGLPPGAPNVTPPPSVLAACIEIILEEGVPVLGTALGDPTPLVAVAHAARARVAAMVTTADEARRVAAGGADIIIAQGAEAGGHRSTFVVPRDREVPLVGTLALVPQVVDAVTVPVVAAGGIADGRGVAAALALGAAAAQIGTRFLVARESGTFPGYRERLLSSSEADTVITSAFTGRPARSLRNAFVNEYRRDGPEPLGWAYQAAAADDIYEAARAADDPEHFPLLAGQGLRLLKRDQGAAEILIEIVAGAERAIARLSGARVGSPQPGP